MAQTPEHKRLALRIHGRVQGVYFRESARTEAERLGLHGWVRNEADGTVSALAEGGAAPLQAFLAWCHKGPPAARVLRVDVSEEPPRGDLAGFTVDRRP